ncbi:MAG TPA: AMP-binding protein, partial [Kofleriaceae bacterium]
MTDLPATLVDLLTARAAAHDGERLYTFLDERPEVERAFSYTELDREARRIATALRETAPAGARIVLLYPPGLEYIAAFFGCLYAGMVAVPAYPPEPGRLERSVPRLRAMAQDARAQVVLTSGMIAAIREMLFVHAPELRELRWIASDAPGQGDAAAWTRPAITAGDLAFLQYTSGSTGTPKGVMLSHANLIHNLGMSAHGFQLGRDSTGVFWLPPYHDMGLIGGILGPLYSGFHAALMSPLTFLRRPLRWLEAISRFRATVSGGPNFAYDLCVRKVSAAEAGALELASWTLAFTGADTVRPETLDRFTRAFAGAGFRRDRFYPCYGLAEGTLIVSGGEPAAPPIVQVVDGRALERHRVVAAAADHPNARGVVGCGRSLLDQTVVIAQPETGARLADGEVGEIWVSGPSVALGYWQRADDSARVFHARLADGAGPFLRTGDLGFLIDGELFIAGRLKDVVIIRGRNHYPQDLELSVERCHPALRPGNVAAFSVEVASEERLVVVQEADPQRLGDPGEVVAAVREALSAGHELPLYALVLTAPGSMFKTSSGKIQRGACRAAYLAGQLPVLAAWTDGSVATRQDEPAAPRAEPPASPGALERWLAEQIAAQLGVRVGELDVSAPITRYGLDSLGAVELGHALERATGAVFAMERLLAGPSIAALAAQIAAARASGTAGISPAPAAAALTAGLAQQRLWFLDRLHPGDASYNLPAALRLRGPLDAARL